MPKGHHLGSKLLYAFKGHLVHLSNSSHQVLEGENGRPRYAKAPVQSKCMQLLQSKARTTAHCKACAEQHVQSFSNPIQSIAGI